MALSDFRLKINHQLNYDAVSCVVVLYYHCDLSGRTFQSGTNFKVHIKNHHSLFGFNLKV